MKILRTIKSHFQKDNVNLIANNIYHFNCDNGHLIQKEK